METSRPTAIDLFCGAGGMSLGFEQAGFDVVAAFDLEQFNIVTHKANFSKTTACAVNLADESAISLRRVASLGTKAIDVVFGGPPCQGFSVGGRGNVADGRNLLIHEFARIVDEFQPKYFVMENVSGLMLGRSRPILLAFLKKIKDAGYSIVEPISILDAADFGVPQRRKRTIILGHLNNVPAPTYPDPQKVKRSRVWRAPPLVKHAIADLQFLDRLDGLQEFDNFNGDLPNPRSTYARVLRGLVEDPSDRSPLRKLSDGITGCLRSVHSSDVIERFSHTSQGSAEPISRYIRLAWNEVSPTIRAGTGSDHGSHTAPRPIHPHAPRCISSREAARLHSFPDWFQFHGTRWHDFRQIGNSVPPLLARAVAERVLECITSVRQKPMISRLAHSILPGSSSRKVQK